MKIAFSKMTKGLLLFVFFSISKRKRILITS